MGDDTVVIEPGESAVAPVVVEAPDNNHDLNQMILECLREIRSLYDTQAATTSSRLAELEGRLATLQSQIEHQVKPVTEEAKEQALEEITQVGEIISDLAESVIPAPGVDNIVTEPSAPVSVSSQNDSGAEAETIVEPDIGTTGSPTSEAPANRRNGRRRIAGIPW